VKIWETEAQQGFRLMRVMYPEPNF